MAKWPKKFNPKSYAKCFLSDVGAAEQLEELLYTVYEMGKEAGRLAAWKEYDAVNCHPPPPLKRKKRRVLKPYGRQPVWARGPRPMAVRDEQTSDRRPLGARDE